MVGDHGAILHSPNGKENYHATTGQFWEDVKYVTKVGSQIVAWGHWSVHYTFDEGTKWLSRTVSYNTATNLKNAYKPLYVPSLKLHVICTAAGGFLVTPDFVVWKNIKFLPDVKCGPMVLVNGNPFTLASDGIYNSTDLTTWKSVSKNVFDRVILGFNNKIMIGVRSASANSINVYLSYDFGFTWSNSINTLECDGKEIQLGPIVSNPLYFAVSSQNCLWTAPLASISTKSTWKKLSNVFSELPVAAVATEDNTIHFAAPNTYYYSNDAALWKSESYFKKNFAQISDMIALNKKAMIVGTNGLVMVTNEEQN